VRVLPVDDVQDVAPLEGDAQLVAGDVLAYMLEIFFSFVNVEGTKINETVLSWQAFPA
jgi:hypothetical protein